MTDIVWTAVLVYNALMLAVLFGLAWTNPGLVRRGYPPAIKAAARPQTPEEIVKVRRLAAPVMAVLLGLPLGYLMGVHLLRHLDFFGLWLEGFVLLFSFNVVDLLIVDWLFFCTITPAAMVLPGTEGHPDYKDYLFHFKGFLKGTVIVAVVSLVFAALAWQVPA